MSSSRPNIILIVTDDQGFADASCQGSSQIQTPSLDRLAAEGVRFTDFHVTAAQCTPSRASILTGKYPQRLGLEGVILPEHSHGLDPLEPNLAKELQACGYRTALFGKWHLGHQPEFLPQQQGFETFYGLPYSHDMFPALIYRDDQVVDQAPDPRTLTRTLTDEALNWLDSTDERPFFACLWHPMPHRPALPSEEFEGSSQFGNYGDACQELDHHLGRVMTQLEESDEVDNTIIIYTSDNGPYQPRGRPDPNEGGSAFPLRGNKTTEYEGGLRVPCVVRWPDRIPGGRTSDVFWSAMDLMPTLAAAAGVAWNHEVDGFDCRDLWSGRSTATPYEHFFYYHYNRLDGVRSGRWKLMLERRNEDDHYFHYHGPHSDEAHRLHGDPDAIGLKESLFDLAQDVSEQTNVSAAHPEVVKRLHGLLNQARNDLGDSRSGTPGAGRRPPAIALPRCVG